MEKIDIVDSNLNVIRRGYRGEKLTSGEYLKFVHVWLIKGDKVLIQKRSSTRKWAPNKWATNTGIVGSNEDETLCAIREIKEELGVDITKDDIYLGFTTEPIEEFDGIGFIYFATFENQDVKIDNDEVCEYKFVSLEELKELVLKNTFIKYFEKHRKGYYYQKVFKNIENIIGGLNE